MVISSSEDLDKTLALNHIISTCDRPSHKIKELASILYKLGHKFYYLQLSNLSDLDILNMVRLDMFTLLEGHDNINCFQNGNIGCMFYIEVI